MSETKVELETGADGTSQLRVQLGEEQGEEVLIEVPCGDELVWSTIMFIVQVGLYQWRRCRSVPNTLYELLKGLDMSFLADVEDEYYMVNRSRYTYKLEIGQVFIYFATSLMD